MGNITYIMGTFIYPHYSEKFNYSWIHLTWKLVPSF